MFVRRHHIFVKEVSKWLALVLATGCLAASPPGDGQVQWGINGHPFSQSGYYDIPLDTQVGLVAESGARWYRVDVSTRDFEASTARLDELLVIAEKSGVRLLPVLIESPGARDSGGTPGEIRSSSARFAQVIAGRYKGRITHWELSNELDDYALIRKGDTTRSGKKWEWGQPDGSRTDDYEEDRYQRAKAEIIGLGEGVKAADPDARCIVDTAGWLHYGFIERLVAEDHVPFDILSWHWYSEMGDISRVQGSIDLPAYLGRYGKPLWLTEVGRRGGSWGGAEREQASYLADHLKSMAANPAIGALFVYELLDQPYLSDASEAHYGLVTLGRNPSGTWIVTGKKAAFGALSSVARGPIP